MAVAERRSFARAADGLGVSKSGAEPCGPRPGGAAGRAPAQPHHPQRGAHRGGRAAPGAPPPCDGRPRQRAGDRQRLPRTGRRAACA
ncbi:MAG: hypothetical protein WDM92_10765 [Caulobacteraceae bacterium]